MEIKKKVTKVGSMAILVKALPAGRAFWKRIYRALKSIAWCFYFIRISNKIKLDLQMLVVFLEKVNGYTKFSTYCRLVCGWYINSSGVYGCGFVFGDKWSWLAGLACNK